MTAGVALEYIKRRAAELCYGDDFTIRYRHFVLRPNEQKELKAFNQFFVLVEPHCDLRVESDAALFDTSEEHINELQYEHRGDILIINQSIFQNQARFIQVIPKQDKSSCQ